MSKKNNNQKADANNPNKGTKGTNITWDKNHENRARQLDPNQNPKK